MLQGGSSGKRYLDNVEEEELVVFLKGCAKMGYPRTRKDVIGLVQTVLQAKGRDTVLSTGWWESFKKRHPDLSLRTAEQLAQVRSRCCNKEALEDYFDLLDETLQDNELCDKPVQMFNCDEMGMSLDPKPLMVVVPKGIKHPRSITTGNKS